MSKLSFTPRYPRLSLVELASSMGKSQLEDKRMASRLIRNQLPERVAGSTPVSSAFFKPFHEHIAG